MRSALVTISLAVLTLLLSLAALVSVQVQQASSASRQQLASELFATVSQLQSVVNTGEENWSQSDELAQLVAVADVQTKTLSETPGFLSVMASASIETAVQEVDADWLTLREALVAAPVASTPEELPKPAIAEVTVTGNIDQLANDFSLIRTRVFEGIQSAQLRSLADNTESNWSRLLELPDNDADIVNIIDQQKTLAENLMRLSGADTRPVFIRLQHQKPYFVLRGRCKRT